eukprot:6373487-Karenia_brevis.AAC.1
MFAAFMIASLLPKATVHFAPQCSTWLNMCRYTTKRLQPGFDIMGDETRVDVKEANATALATSA